MAQCRHAGSTNSGLSASASTATHVVTLDAALAFAGAVKRVTDENDNSYNNQFAHKKLLLLNQNLDITVLTKATTNTTCLFMSIATASTVIAS